MVFIVTCGGVQRLAAHDGKAQDVEGTRKPCLFTSVLVPCFRLYPCVITRYQGNSGWQSRGDKRRQRNLKYAHPDHSAETVLARRTSSAHSHRCLPAKPASLLSLPVRMLCSNKLGLVNDQFTIASSPFSRPYTKRQINMGRDSNPYFRPTMRVLSKPNFSVFRPSAESLFYLFLFLPGYCLLFCMYCQTPKIQNKNESPTMNEIFTTFHWFEKGLLLNPTDGSYEAKVTELGTRKTRLRISRTKHRSVKSGGRRVCELVALSIGV